MRRVAPVDEVREEVVVPVVPAVVLGVEVAAAHCVGQSNPRSASPSVVETSGVTLICARGTSSRSGVIAVGSLMNSLQISLRFSLFLPMLIWSSGCGETKRTQSPASIVQPRESSERTYDHPAEAAAEEFVSLFSRDELPIPRPTIPVLRKLKEDDREEAIETLGQYIRAHCWTLWFTEIVVTDGKDDVATCFLKGGADEHLVLMLAFQNDGWLVTAYEIPARPWARRNGETLGDFVTKQVSEAKEQGTALHNGPLTDGLYLLEH